MNTMNKSSSWTHAGLCAFALVLTIVAAGPLLGQPKMKTKPNQGVEPPLELTLEYNGKQVPVTLGKPFKVRVGDRAVSMKLTRKPYRVFQAAGVRFKYPAHHAFEYDGSIPESPLWTLDGNDNTIMVMSSEGADANAARSSMVEQLTNAYGRKNVKITNVSLRLAGRTLQGKRVAARVAGVDLKQDIFTLVHNKKTLLLMIQDSPKDDGTTSRDTLQAKKLLQESFELIE